jgi:hypothetical protein
MYVASIVISHQHTLWALHKSVQLHKYPASESSHELNSLFPEERKV